MEMNEGWRRGSFREDESDVGEANESQHLSPDVRVGDVERDHLLPGIRGEGREDGFVIRVDDNGRTIFSESSQF